MALVTSNQFDISPDFVGSFSKGLKQGGQFGKLINEGRDRSRNEQVRDALVASQIGGEEGEANLEKFQQEFPEESQAFEAKQIALQDQKFASQSGREKQNTQRNASDMLQLSLLGSDQERMQQLNRNAQRNAEAGLTDSLTTNKDTQFLIDLFQNDPVAANKFIGAGVQVGERLGLIQPATSGKNVTKIREETRGQVRGQLKSIGNEANVIRSNFQKLTNLSEEIRGGNRTAVPQALVSIVKLGDPGSIVSTNEMRGAVNAQDPVSAIFNLLTSKGVNGDLAQSVASRIDPLDPKNLNVDDLLATGRATVSAFVPQLQDRLAIQEDIAERNLTQEGVNALFSQKMRDSISGLSDLFEGAGRGKGLPSGISEEDVTETMDKTGLTREQVLERLNGG